MAQAPSRGLPSGPTRGPRTEGVIVQTCANRWKISEETLWGVYGTETGFGKNVKTSSAGAEGPFQFMPATAKLYNVNVKSFPSSACGAAHYLHDLGADDDPDSSATANALNKYSGGGGSAYVAKVKTNGKTFHDTPISDAVSTAGNAVDAALSPLEALSDFVGLIGQASTWSRVGKVVFGASLLGMGALALILAGGKEVAKSPVVRKVASVTPIGRAAKVVK